MNNVSDNHRITPPLRVSTGPPVPERFEGEVEKAEPVVPSIENSTSDASIPF